MTPSAEQFNALLATLPGKPQDTLDRLFTTILAWPATHRRLQPYRHLGGRKLAPDRRFFQTAPFPVATFLPMATLIAEIELHQHGLRSLAVSDPDDVVALFSLVPRASLHLNAYSYAKERGGWLSDLEDLQLGLMSTELRWFADTCETAGVKQVEITVDSQSAVGTENRHELLPFLQAWSQRRGYPIRTNG